MAVVTGPFNDFTDFKDYYLPVALTLDWWRARMGQLNSYKCWTTADWLKWQQEKADFILLVYHFPIPENYKTKMPRLINKQQLMGVLKITSLPEIMILNKEKSESVRDIFYAKKLSREIGPSHKCQSQILA